MIYFGQEVGEPGAEHAGFGSPTRTSIFDYVGVPHHQRWMNGGKFDGGQLTASERALRDFYKRLLSFTSSSSALMGNYNDLHAWNRQRSQGYNDKLFSFARWSKDQKLIVFSNFNDHGGFTGTLHVTEYVIKQWALKDGSYRLKDELYGEIVASMQVINGEGTIQLTLQPLESLILSLQ
jgi:glycosidase